VLKPLAQEFGGDSADHSGAGIAKLETSDADAAETRTVSVIGDARGAQFGRLS